MLWIHPLIALAASAAAAYALYLGFIRFQALHLGKKGVQFLWKRHVSLGSLAVAGWTAGLLLGLGGAWFSWNAVLITGQHHLTALVMAPLMLFGYLSGRIMDKTKKRRRYLPLAHGLCNALLTVMAVLQVVSGAELVTAFLLS